MIGKREFEGYWWVPGRSDEKVEGILNFSQDEIQLRLFSALCTKEETTINFDKLFGLTPDGKKITLENVKRLKYTNSGSYDNRIMSTENSVNRIFVGDHFEHEPRFDQLKITFPLLYEWSDITGIESDNEIDEKSGELIYKKIGQKPAIRTADLGELNINLSIDITSKNSLGSQSLVEDAYFYVSPDQGRISFEEAREHMRQLQAFISLALSEEVHPAEFIGQNFVDSGLEDGDQVPMDIEMLYRTSGDTNQPTDLDPGSENFLFTDIEDRFTPVMKNWFSKYKELQPVFSIYFATRYNSNLYLQNEFLNLTRAIESYHRIGREGIYLSEDEFEDYYEDLVDNIPKRYDQSFKDHLKDGAFKYANEYSLRKRLNILNDEYEDILSILPIEFSDKISPIVDARNDLTHQETEGDRPDTEDLIHLSDILKALLEIIILKEIGISDQQIKEKTDSRYRYRLNQGN